MESPHFHVAFTLQSWLPWAQVTQSVAVQLETTVLEVVGTEVPNVYIAKWKITFL